MSTLVVPLIILAIVLAVPLYAVFLYNRLVSSRNLVEEGWSGIEVQLKRRANLVPNLVETVKGYASHERSVLEDVTRARTGSVEASGVDQKREAENIFTAALGRLFALAEDYPDLKADENFRDFQEQLADIEDAIQKARRYYNGAVRQLNTLIEVFPSNLVASQFQFQRADYFEIDDPQTRLVPSVDFSTS